MVSKFACFEDSESVCYQLKFKFGRLGQTFECPDNRKAHHDHDVLAIEEESVP